MSLNLPEVWMSKECRELRGQNLALDSMGGKSERNLARKTLQTLKIQIPGAQKSKIRSSLRKRKEMGILKFSSVLSILKKDLGSSWDDLISFNRILYLWEYSCRECIKPPSSSGKIPLG